MAHTLQEFQKATTTVVLINTIRKEAHLLGFHGRAAVHKPLITKSNRADRLKWCMHVKIVSQMSGNRFFGVMKLGSISVSRMAESEFGVSRPITYW